MQANWPFKNIGLLGSLASALLLFFIVPTGNAQTTSGPQFFMTWQASNSYVPSFYKDKALPGAGSRITASFDLVSQGKILNISGQTIYWYLNGNYIGGGVGAEQITFSPGVLPPNDITLEAKIPNYNGAILVHDVTIPVVQPVAVIASPYPQDQFSENPFTLQAEAYFFNTPDLSSLVFNWSVNGQDANSAENPSEAQISIPQGSPSGSTLAVSLVIKNPADSAAASASQNLTYQAL